MFRLVYIRTCMCTCYYVMCSSHVLLFFHFVSLMFYMYLSLSMGTYAVQEQASWVCQCEEGMVSGVEQDFKLTLQKEVCT